MGHPADETVADKGYSSGTQLQEAERRRLPVLVPAQDESSEKGDFAKSRFHFDRERDLYVCPRGQEIPFEVKVNATTGKPALRVYRCGNAECPVKSECTTDKRGRAIKRHETEDAMARQAEKLSKPANQVLSSLRKEIVEHIFGIVKTVDGFRRFTAWGLESAKAQWALACLAINLRKLMPAVRAGRLTAASFG